MSALSRASTDRRHHWHLVGDLPALLLSVVVYARLALIPTPLEPTHSFVALAGLLARRSTSSSTQSQHLH
jgi:hypothetical protein